jgi:hypothetical protein
MAAGNTLNFHSPQANAAIDIRRVIGNPMWSEWKSPAETASGVGDRSGHRVLLLVGHDTNIATVAGALAISWIMDRRRNDAPSGGTLVFEVSRSNKSGANSVRTCCTTQPY